MFTIYRITNILDGTEYIGKHVCRCLNCSYMGSGKILKAAIKKYGPENFSKEILFILASEVEMDAKEAELVTEEYCGLPTTYNICAGGRGGFGYINGTGLADRTGSVLSVETKRRIGLKSLGRNHSDESKRKIAEANQRTNETRGQKVSAALAGTKKSAEHRKKISEAIKRRNILKKAGML